MNSKLLQAILSAVHRQPSAQRASLVGWRAVRDAMKLGPSLIEVTSDDGWTDWPPEISEKQ